jgi:4-hydroxy-tetrahydrodipicolinate synthase
MVAFYAEVASATDLPLMAYNHPTGGLDDLTPELLARLIEVEHVVAVKESSGEVRRIAAAIEATGGEMEVVAGTDDIALEAYAAGASGWVTGVGDVAPAECVELWRLLEARELEAAQALWLRLLPLARLDTDPKLVQFYKASLDRIGRYGGPTRPPRLPLTADEQARVTAAIEALWGENGGQASVDGDPAVATGSVGER